MNRRLFLTTAGAGVVTAALAGQVYSAGWPWSRSADIIYTGIVDGVAVGGYDPVAYFTEGRPVAGDPAIVLEKDGVTWRFASAANRDRFEADPARYAPQYGGHCAWAMANGYRAKGDPQNWDIVDGKLYLNFNNSIQGKWQKDPQGFITRAAPEWKKILADANS